MKISTYCGVFIITFVISSVKTNQAYCRATCSECKHGVCKECYYGYWGIACEKQCVDCWQSGCDKHKGRCIQCKPGLYTDDCSEPCPHHCRPSYDNVKNCDRTTGKCLEGCIKGRWGSKCKKTCSQGCGGDYCYQENGGCFRSCRAGWYGRSCDHHNCLIRNPDNGICRTGCKDRWKGKACIEKCTEGCVTCNQYDKVCTTSCRDGLYGSQCESECSPNCFYKTCDMTGRCNYGCHKGFHGNSCNNTCPSDCLECEQETGMCIRCEKGKECLADFTTQKLLKTDAQVAPTSPSTNTATMTVKATITTLTYMGTVISYLATTR